MQFTGFRLQPCSREGALALPRKEVEVIVAVALRDSGLMRFGSVGGAALGSISDRRGSSTK